MVNINVTLEEPLKVYKTSSGSSPCVDMSIYVIKSTLISRETVPLTGRKMFDDKSEKSSYKNV
jgi:hypothetical protein